MNVNITIENPHKWGEGNAKYYRNRWVITSRPDMESKVQMYNRVHGAVTVRNSTLINLRISVSNFKESLRFFLLIGNSAQSLGPKKVTEFDRFWPVKLGRTRGRVSSGRVIFISSKGQSHLGPIFSFGSSGKYQNTQSPGL